MPYIHFHLLQIIYYQLIFPPFALRTNRKLLSSAFPLIYDKFSFLQPGICFSRQPSFKYHPDWCCNLWYLPLASRITKFKALLEPKEPCRGTEGLSSPWGDWQGNSSVSLQEFSHKSTACWHSVFEAAVLKDMKQRRKMTQMHLHFKITKVEGKERLLSKQFM